MLRMRVHGPGPAVKTVKQTNRQRKDGGVLFPEDVSDCLAGWVG